MYEPVYNKLGLNDSKWSYTKVTKSSPLLLLVHVIAICGALTIIVINLNGLWVGKELTGTIQQDGIKLLVLQITSKLHELLILTSLGDILFTHIFKRFSKGEELPLAALTAGLSFRDISYLCSSEFLAVCRSSFSKKTKILILIISATVLGVFVGPSSATAISPKLDDWVTGDLDITLNATSQQLWPSLLIADDTSQASSSGLSTTSRTLADNLFTFWGHATLGTIFALPEQVNVLSSSSLRTMNTRFRGPLNLYQPQYTTATVQPAVIADTVNALRMTWFRANSNKCAQSTSSQGFCSYKDIIWSIDALQPVVYTACAEYDETTLPSFPIIDHEQSGTNLIQYNKSFIFGNSTLSTQLHWVSFEGTAFDKMSVAVVVKPAHMNGLVYACSVKAQWANSTIQTSFLNGAYVVDGTPPYFDVPLAEGSNYHGRTVSLTSEWSDTTVSSADVRQTNTTVFDTLFEAGAVTPDSNLGAKIEAVIATLIAENMAQTGHNATLIGKLDNYDDLLQRSGRVFQVVTGYAYGMCTASAFSIATLLSLLTLFAYTVVALWHIVMTRCLTKHEILPWRATIDVLGLVFNSTPNQLTHRMSFGIKDVDTLALPIMIKAGNDDAEVLFGSKR